MSKLSVDDRLKVLLERTLPEEIGGGVVTFGVLLELRADNANRFVVAALPTPVPQGS